MNLKKAWIHGVLSGDGSLVKSRPRTIPRPSHREKSMNSVGWSYRVILWNKNDRLLTVFDSYIKSLYGKNPGKCKDGHVLYSKAAYEDLKAMGDIGTRKWDVPEMPPLALRRWIKGFFDAEGTVDITQKRIRAKSVNNIGLKNLALKLVKLGINSKVTGPNCDGTWYITISKKCSVCTFSKIIGFEHPEKRELMSNIISR